MWWAYGNRIHGIKMISLSKEWALLSREMYGQKFIDELADFLQKQNVKTILECGCGDGYVLHGLAKKGLGGRGIDENPEMIALALENHQHPNIYYKQMNWLDRDLEGRFDAVMCRGNSLSAVVSWGNEHPNLREAKGKIGESINLFFQKLKEGGLLYVDTCSQEEVDRNGGNIEIITPNIQLRGNVEYDWQKMERRVFGRGKVFGEDFSGGSVSYLLTPKELEEIVRSHSPSVVWTPKLKHEQNYHIVCAKKCSL